MKNWIVSLGMISLLFLMACEEDEDMVDTTAPTISIEDPLFGESFAAGGEIHFDALFEDDVALATYNITIHDNFDGHGHGRILVEAFDFDQSYELTGKSDDVHEDIAIPAEATAGPYHFIVEAIDAAGNSTTFADGSSKEIEIWLTNEETPHIHFHDANGNEVAEYDGEVGEPLMFYGEVEDESGALDHVMIKVGHMEETGEAHDHEGDDHEGDRILEDDIYEKEFEVEGQTAIMIQDLLSGENISVAQSDLDELEEGEHLYLIVRAEDEDGNISRKAIEIHFD